ncbi:helix-turn-helix domain-containing protein [Streptomyces sp. NBC_01261]|uniref:helix-turn-helix domain-containing protein n=1 Tax=Streptomyces sp. NBC_01261 TaxID=2903802 RepID=UPI002E2F71CB|nr:helix-turn-helix domain-containing protein [Streptomyces sp. NBC_01261]
MSTPEDGSCADGQGGRPGRAVPAWGVQLLEQLRPGARDVSRLAGWLGEVLGGAVALTDGEGRWISGEPVRLGGELVADIASGRIAAAAVEQDGRYVRLVAVGDRRPYPVLAVERAQPFDAQAAAVLTCTGGVLDLVLRESALAQEHQRLEQAAFGLRLAVLQLLMVGETASASRAAAGLCPGLLDTDACRVYVLEGRPEGRDGLARDCEAAVPGRLLVVRCPADDQHLIIVAPQRADTDDVRTALRQLAARRPGVFLGGSTRHPLAHTAAAYAEALSALAVAHFQPARAAMYATRTHPAQLMDPAAADRWAAALLHPLDMLPHHTQGELLATVRLGLQFTAVNAAKILGVSRNTVRARMDRAAELLDLDLSDLSTRAALHLALHARADAAAPPAGPGPLPGTGEPPGLERMLAGAEVRLWAEDLLRRLTDDDRDLRGTLRAWITCGASTEQAAHRLGLHVQTVRQHIRSAEPLLQRCLLSAGSELYEVVLAHMAMGETPIPAPGRPQPSHHPATVHV